MNAFSLYKFIQAVLVKITANLSSLERYEKLLQNYYQTLEFISELLSRELFLYHLFAVLQIP